MDDVNAFERQLASVVQQTMKPPHPVDAMAIVRSATTTPGRWSVTTRRLRGSTTPAPKERGFSMFSALKFIAAGVIVALFGGFLLAGLLPAQPADDVAPAAVTASPSPTTTEELLSGMLTEEVEPGVLRITGDGIHDPTPDTPLMDGFPSSFVDVAPDGGVWLSGGDHLYRFGDDRSYEDGGDAWGTNRHVDFTPDGTLWAYGEDSVRTFTGGTWVVRHLPGLWISDLAVGPDGDAWAVAWHEDADGASLLRLAPTPDAGRSYRPFDGWADLGLVEDFQPESIEVTPDGSAWLLGAERGEVRLLRFDDQGWEVVDAPTSHLNGSSPRALVAGPDATLWLVGGDWNTSGGQRRLALARLGSDGWSPYEVMDAGIGWGQSHGPFANNAVVDVAPDGALWLNASAENTGEYAGVARFDGASWQRFLDGRSVHDLDVGPDGAVWVRAADASTEGQGAVDGAVDLYVITPEAMTATN